MTASRIWVDVIPGAGSRGGRLVLVLVLVLVVVGSVALGGGCVGGSVAGAPWGATVTGGEVVVVLGFGFGSRFGAFVVGVVDDGGTMRIVGGGVVGTVTAGRGTSVVLVVGDDGALDVVLDCRSRRSVASSSPPDEASSAMPAPSKTASTTAVSVNAS